MNQTKVNPFSIAKSIATQTWIQSQCSQCSGRKRYKISNRYAISLKNYQRNAQSFVEFYLQAWALAKESQKKILVLPRIFKLNVLLHRYAYLHVFQMNDNLPLVYLCRQRCDSAEKGDLILHLKQNSANFSQKKGDIVPSSIRKVIRVFGKSLSNLFHVTFWLAFAQPSWSQDPPTFFSNVWMRVAFQSTFDWLFLNKLYNHRRILAFPAITLISQFMLLLIYFGKVNKVQKSASQCHSYYAIFSCPQQLPNA